MTHIRRCFAVVLALPLGALNAQETRALAAGARVRVMEPKAACNVESEGWPCYRRVVGSLESIDSATIVVRLQNGETVNVSRAPGTRLDVNVGQGPCANRGTCILLGVLSGSALGVAVGAGRGCTDLCAPFYFFTGSIGALVGAIVGAALPAKHWEEIPVPAHLTVAPDGSGRFALGVSVRF